MIAPSDRAYLFYPVIRTLPQHLVATPTIDNLKSFLRAKVRKLRVLSLICILGGVVFFSFWELSMVEVDYWPIFYLACWASVGATIYYRSNSYDLSDDEIICLLDEINQNRARLTSGWS